jgi:DNA-binding IclR family transcriptional regulator
MAEQYVVPGLDRALTVLELLAEHPEGLSMIEIAARTGFPNNSVYRIAITLVRRGYLRRSLDTKRFAMTRKFLMLAFPRVQQRNIVELALDGMNQLRDAVGESVLLATFHEREGVVLAQAPALHPIRLMVEPGTRFDLHSSGPGKALLANVSEPERTRLLGSLEYRRHTSRTICDPGQLLEELEEARLRGYAVDRGESFEGVHCVAAPVYDEHARVLAAIWVSGPSTRLKETDFARIGPRVVESARQISLHLGYYGDSSWAEHATAVEVCDSDRAVS